MAKVVILGGGLAGISAAYHLEQKGFTDYKLFEKEATLGGLCGSIEQDGFTFDYTGHLLHISDPYFRQLIDQVVGFEHFNVIHRRSFIYSQERYTPYPFQMNLHGLPTKTIADCIEGYVKRHTHIKKPTTFKQWVLKQFGPGFAKHFFFPYQRKIFAHNLNNITASWTGRFVPSTSLEKILEGAIQKKDVSVGYNAQFFYPKQGGIMFWVQKLADQLKQIPYTQCKATHIDCKQRTVTFEDGHIEPYSILINTLPLDHTIRMIHGASSRSFYTAADKLLCNSVLNFNLGIAQANLSDKHWIYFPENVFPFYRLGFTSNFARSMAPENCSSLYGEIAYINKSDRWKKQQLKQAVEKTTQLLGITSNDIVMQKNLDISHAYVIYDHWREKKLPKLLHALTQEHIYSIGRYGAWKYCSMQETLLDGKEVINKILVHPARVWQTTTQQPTKQKELSL